MDGNEWWPGSVLTWIANGAIHGRIHYIHKLGGVSSKFAVTPQEVSAYTAPIVRVGASSPPENQLLQGDPSSFFGSYPFGEDLFFNSVVNRPRPRTASHGSFL